MARGGEDLLEEAGDVTVLQVQPAPRDGRDTHFAVARAGAGLLVACDATGGYRLEPGRLEVTAAPRGDTEAWEHRLLAVVVPLLLAERGDLVLHAAVVETEQGALVLCGPSERGKSTLALAFAEGGRTVLSEDGAVISSDDGGWLTWPAATGVRVREPGSPGWPRRLVTLDGPEPRAQPPRALVLLEERGDALRVSRMEAAEALTALAPHLIHSGGQSGLGAAFARLATLLGEVPAFRASLPDDLAGVPDAAQALVREVTRDFERAEK